MRTLSDCNRTDIIIASKQVYLFKPYYFVTVNNWLTPVQPQ